MTGQDSLPYGRPLRGRHDAWIYRRSARLVPLLLRTKSKSKPSSGDTHRPGDNDNAAGPENRQPSTDAERTMSRLSR